MEGNKRLCSEVQQELTLSPLDELSDERKRIVREHLLQCAECYSFARTMEVLTSCRTPRATLQRPVNVWPAVKSRIVQQERRSTVFKWVLIPVLNLLILGVFATRLHFREPVHPDAAEKEIVQNIELLSDYDVVDRLDFLEKTDL